MRVAVFPSDNGGCGWYRLRHPARVLAGQGHDVQVAPLGETHGMFREHRRQYDDGSDVLEAVEVDADVLVFQRVVARHNVEVIAQAKAQGLRVVVDVDDDLDALHAHHPYLEDLAADPDRGAGWLHEACDLADTVTVTTPALADRYGRGKAVVLPNLVPEAYLTHRRVKSRRVAEPLLVGWTGRPISHIGDARVMGGRVGPVVAQAGARFAAWGQSAPETFRQAAIPQAARRRMPFRDLTGGYPQQVGKLDVGLVPLVDSPFNRAKSWLKGLEYAALGVPFVASPLPEYRKLHQLGAGVLASTPAEWERQVHWLLEDRGARAELAAAGREVARGLTYEAHAGRWLDAWTTVMTQEQRSCGRVMVAEGEWTAPAPV